MHAELENWNNGWYGLHLSLRPAEIQHLIELLGQLMQDPEQHFHISANYSGAGGIGDIEICAASASETDNMHLSGLAISPGSDLPAAGA